MKLRLIREIILGSVIIISLSCFGKKDDNIVERSRIENDWKKDNLKGRIKSYTETLYEGIEYNDIIKKGKRYSYFHKEFDIYGNLLEWSKYNSEGILEEKETFEYNESNDKILWITTNPIQNYYTKKIYKYAKNRKLIEENHFREDGSMYQQILYKHNQKGYNVAREEYDDDGNLRYIEFFIIDNEGNQIERNAYHPYYQGNKFSNKSTYKYDDKGYKIEDNWYDTEHSTRSRQTKTYNYDKNGNEIEYSLYEYGTLKVTNTSRYNDKGYLIEWIHNNSNGHLKKITKKYDDKGNEIEESFYSEGNILGKVFSKSVSKYSYDTRGNWTEKIYADEIFKNITERQFEYYK